MTVIDVNRLNIVLAGDEIECLCDSALALNVQRDDVQFAIIMTELSSRAIV